MTLYPGGVLPNGTQIKQNSLLMYIEEGFHIIYSKSNDDGYLPSLDLLGLI